MKEIKLSKTQQDLLSYIIQKYKASGQFTDTNRKLGIMFKRTAQTMQYNLKALRREGLIECETVVGDDGYVIRYVTPADFMLDVSEEG